ncbi:sialate O-acetylesterase [Saccharicrinis sp. FJH62]|uniref:sialate O-acetylesterase n=1 Tax=Saccharicrinis sp. FJH62 TaxID=3344657 RepID=UPI0035D5020B
MKNRIITALTVLLFIPTFASAKKTAVKDTIMVFYLGGQSNMDGYGFVKDLPDSLKKTNKNVWIFQGNTARDNETGGGIGIWEQLKPGHGRGTKSDATSNTYSDRFGVELSLAQRLQALYPDQNIALIKYSRGGTSIDQRAARGAGSWDPNYTDKTGINQYDHFLETVKNAYAVNDINGDGVEDVLVPAGIFWMQGESDGDFTEDVAAAYYDNLNQLMGLIRAAFRSNDLPVVIGKISDSGVKNNGITWPYGDLVQYGEEKFARTDANATIVRSTKKYSYSDPWHYTSPDYIDLGIEFANALYQLKDKK